MNHAYYALSHSGDWELQSEGDQPLTLNANDHNMRLVFVESTRFTSDAGRAMARFQLQIHTEVGWEILAVLYLSPQRLESGSLVIRSPEDSPLLTATPATARVFRRLATVPF